MDELYYTQSNLKTMEKNIQKSGRITEEDKKLILAFKKEAKAYVSDKRVLYYLRNVKTIAEETNRTFDQMDTDYMKGVVADIERSVWKSKAVYQLPQIERLVKQHEPLIKAFQQYKHGHIGKQSFKSQVMESPLSDNVKIRIKKLLNHQKGQEDYSEHSKKGFKQTLRKFFQWKAGYEWNSEEYPDMVKWISTNIRKNKLKNPTILSKREVLRMFRAAEGVQEKAKVTFMYETGCRCPEELLGLKWKDVDFADDIGALVTLASGKVGERTPQIVMCVPALKEWYKLHPDPSPDNYVWVNERQNRGNRLSYTSFRNKVQKWVYRAGIQKQVRPNNLRHSRITHISGKWGQRAIIKYFGTTQLDTYENMTMQEANDALLSSYGLRNESEELSIEPIFCVQCGNQDIPEEGKEFCKYCEAPLTEQAMEQIDKKKQEKKQQLLEEAQKEQEQWMHEMRKEFEPMMKKMIKEKFMEMFGEDKEMLKKAMQHYPQVFNKETTNG